MLHWSCQPDEAFVAILDSALCLAIDEVNIHLAGASGEEDGVGIPFLFGERVCALFEAKQLAGELRKLLLAHRSARTYLPGDYHFLLLHDVLAHWIDLHNDRVHELGRPLDCGPVLLGPVDFDVVRNHFWDEDFLLDPQVMDRLSEEDKQMAGFSPETFGLVQGFKPHPKELELVEVQAESSAPMGAYRPGAPYPAFEADQP